MHQCYRIRTADSSRLPIHRHTRRKMVCKYVGGQDLKKKRNDLSKREEKSEKLDASQWTARHLTDPGIHTKGEQPPMFYCKGAGHHSASYTGNDSAVTLYYKKGKPCHCAYRQYILHCNCSSQAWAGALQPAPGSILCENWRRAAESNHTSENTRKEIKGHCNIAMAIYIFEQKQRGHFITVNVAA